MGLINLFNLLIYLSVFIKFVLIKPTLSYPFNSICIVVVWLNTQINEFVYLFVCLFVYFNLINPLQGFHLHVIEYL